MTAPEPKAATAPPPVRIADTRPPPGRLLDVEVEGAGLFKAYWMPHENLPLGRWSLQWYPSRRAAFLLAHANDRWSKATSTVVERRDDSADLTTAYMVGVEHGKDTRRDDTAELIAAAEAYLHAIDDRLAIKSDPQNVDRFRAARDEVKRTLGNLRAALARHRGEK